MNLLSGTEQNFKYLSAFWNLAGYGQRQSELQYMDGIGSLWNNWNFLSFEVIWLSWNYSELEIGNSMFL